MSNKLMAAALVVVALGLMLLVERLTTDSEPVEPTTATTSTTTMVPGDVFGFVPTGRMTLSCAWCSAARLPDGRVLVVNGLDAALYDPATETFTPAGRPQTHVFGAELVALPSGNVLIVEPEMVNVDPVVQIYDVDAGSFRVLDGARVYGVPVLLDDGRILVFDGVGARYLDADTGEVELAGTMVFSRDPASLVVELLRDGRVLVAGLRTQAELFDPRNGSFTLAGQFHGVVDGFAATALTDGRVLLVGGTDESGTAVASAQVFDPATDTFSPTGSMAFPRSGHTATLLPDGRVLVVGGGLGFQDEAMATAEIYDPVTGLFSPAPPPTRARMAATAVPLDDGRVLIFGHYAGNMPTPGPSGADSAEIFSLARYVQPEGCCAENPSELRLEVTETLGPDEISDPVNDPLRRQLTVTIPAGALDGAINTSLTRSLEYAGGGFRGPGDTGLPTGCEDGCTLEIPLEPNVRLSVFGASNTWTLTVWYMIGYEGSVPQAAEGITAVIAPRAP